MDNQPNMLQEDQGTIASLKMEIRKMTDAATEKEARTRETIQSLKLEIVNLNKHVEQGAGLTMGQEHRGILLRCTSDYDCQNDLLRQFAEKKKEIETYLKEVKDVILEDVLDAKMDKRQSLDARMIMNLPKTPGMTIQKTKRKRQFKPNPISIDLDSPNTSIVSQRTEAECSAMSTMTPNRSKSTLKQTRLRSLLEKQQNSINTTPSGKPVRLTRARLKLLEESLANSTVCSLQKTPRVRIAEEFDETATPVTGTPTNTTVLSKLTPMRPLMETPSRDSTPSCPVANSTMVLPGTPAANSTMVLPGTPAAPFSANITLIKSTPKSILKVNYENIVVSSPIGPITAPVVGGDHCSEEDDEISIKDDKWKVSTGKRKSRSSSMARGTANPMVKRLQLSNHMPSPAPVATPAEKQPALLSLTIAGTPTPENVTVSLFQSPADDVGTSVSSGPSVQTPETANVKPLVLTPGVVLTPKIVQTPGSITRTPAGDVIRTPASDVIKTPASDVIRSPAGDVIKTPASDVIRSPVGDVIRTPAGDVVRSPAGDVIRSPAGDVIRTPAGDFIRTPAGDFIRTPAGDFIRTPAGDVIRSPAGDVIRSPAGDVIRSPANDVTRTPANAADLTRTPNLEDIRTPGKIIRTPGRGVGFFRKTPALDRIVESERGHSGDDLIVNIEGVAEVVESPAKEPHNGTYDVEEKCQANDGDDVPEKDADVSMCSEKSPSESNNLSVDSSEKESVATKPETVDSGSVSTKIKFFEDPNPEPDVEEKKDEKIVEADNEVKLEENEVDVKFVPDEKGHDSSELFESCEEAEAENLKITEESEGEITVPLPTIKTRSSQSKKLSQGEIKKPTPRKTRSATKESISKMQTESQPSIEEKTEAPESSEEIEVDAPKTPVPIRKTRSSRNKNTSIKSAKMEVEEPPTKRSTVKKVTTKKPPHSKIPSPKTRRIISKEPDHDTSKREREESEEDNETVLLSTPSADESIHQTKRMKCNSGAPKNPPNLMTSVFSFINKPVVVIKSAKELEEEKREAARRKIEEKDAKSQLVLNKKKQREVELKQKRLVREKRMQKVKQYKEDEAKKRKAEMEDKLKKKDEAAAKEREAMAKKEEEKRQKEIKRQEQVEIRRKEAEKARELKKKKIQEEAEERTNDALRRKQEIEAQKVRELEKHRLDEEARLEELRRVEAEEHEKRLKAAEERRKQEEEIEKKRNTPTRNTGTKKINHTTGPAVGTLLNLAEATPPKPPPRTNKHTNKPIPKLGATGSLEDVSNLKSDKFEVKTVPELEVKKGGSTASISSAFLNTPLGNASTAPDSPASTAAKNRVQSYMKSKLLSLGQTKGKKNPPNRLDSICEDKTSKRSVPIYDPRDNYKIDDMESGDDTDEETKPKRTVPSWARNKTSLRDALKKQFTAEDRYATKDLFGPFPKTADLDHLFGTVNKYKKRTSSAHWSIAPTTGNLDFSILTEEEVERATNIKSKWDKRT